MPAVRPRASFDPIPPNLDLAALVENTENFEYVVRIPRESIDEQGVEAFEKLVLLHVIKGGKPLVVEGFQNRLEPWTFSAKWLRENHGAKEEDARNLTKKEPLRLTIGHYLSNAARLARQWTPANYRDPARQRIYLKDIDCPQVWEDKLREQIPGGLFYWNESCGDVGGPGAIEEPNLHGTGRRKGRGIARAGDLMSSLPRDMRAVNLMCYIGHEGTYTPAHREMCATLGQNIMVEASGVVDGEGKPEQPGSSIWFMTESKDRQLVSEYWLSVLGHDIEVEGHFAQIVAWRKAPFKTYVVEQKAGDFILIPPLAPHQVWNRGSRTMKVAWNRTTVETLEMAMDEALPRARMVCRDEQYKNKAIIYFTLLKYSALLTRAKVQQAKERDPHRAAALRSGPKIRQLQKDFMRLFKLYQDILLSEKFSSEAPGPKCQYLAFDSNVTCAYCRGNIFNRFLTCETCAGALEHGVEEPYDVCMECYTMGRSCWCLSKYKWVEQFKWKDLMQKYDEYRKQILEFNGGDSSNFCSLEETRERSNKRSLAEICQIALKERPWRDWKKPMPDEALDDDDGDEEINVTDEGTVKKTKKKRSEAWLNSHSSCHTCLKRHPNWKMAVCTNCNKGYCYGSLFRAFDLMPHTVMEDPFWECPHCLKICNVGKCRKDPRQKPYEPKGTLLGHDTKKVADARSTESLVDFSVSNLNWIQEDLGAPLGSVRLKRRQREAERAKQDEPILDDRYVDEEDEAEVRDNQDEDVSMIDPSLRGNDTSPGHGDNTTRNNTRLPPVSAILDGTSYDPMDGYEPARHPDFIAPPAVMYSADGTSSYPDPDQAQSYSGIRAPNAAGGSSAEQGINLVQGRKRKRAEDDPTQAKPVNDATAQYFKEQTKRTLEEAKRAGHLVRVKAQLEGKRKVVRLSLGKDNMSRLRASEDYNRRHSAPNSHNLGSDQGSDEFVIVQSDVHPQATGKALKTLKKGVKDAQVRYRVETDGDFVSRDRHERVRRPNNLNASLSKAPKTTFEEISASEDEVANLDGAVENSTLGTEQAVKRPRISAYLAKRHADEPEMPDELPENWKDSRPGTRKNRVSSAANELPLSRNIARRYQKAQIRPKSSIAPNDATNGHGYSSADDGEGEIVEDGETRSDEPVTARVNPVDVDAVEPSVAPDQVSRLRSPTFIAREALSIAPRSPTPATAPKLPSVRPSKTAAEEEVEAENRRAKLLAAGIILQPARTVDNPSTHATSDVPTTKASIFARPGMQCKKIKIVSAANATTKKSASATPVTTDATKSSGVKPAQEDDVEDATESSGTEIPARRPETALPDKRGRGRPSLPTSARGGKNIPTRGRGRPRKTMQSIAMTGHRFVSTCK